MFRLLSLSLIAGLVFGSTSTFAGVQGKDRFMCFPVQGHTLNHEGKTASFKNESIYPYVNAKGISVNDIIYPKHTVRGADFIIYSTNEIPWDLRSTTFKTFKDTFNNNKLDFEGVVIGVHLTNPQIFYYSRLADMTGASSFVYREGSCQALPPTLLFQLEQHADASEPVVVPQGR